MSSSNVNEEVVLSALKRVMDPELHKDLVTLGMIKNIHIDGSVVNFDLQLTTTACPLKDLIKTNARNAVLEISGVKEVNIRITADVAGNGQKNELLTDPVKHIVAIGSGKGGVGKTTIAVNVAVALAKSGAKVGLLDADIYGPNVPTMMGIHEIPDGENGKINPPIAYGVKVMSIGFLVNPGQALIWRGPILHKTIQQFLSEVNWGELDYLIVDMPPGTGDVQLSLMQSITLSGGVIVTLPQNISLEDASRGLNMFNQMKVPVLGVVENMSYLELPDGNRMDIFGSGGGENLAEINGVKYLGGVPIDSMLREGSDSGKPVVQSQPESPVAKAIQKVAEEIAAALSVQVLRDKSG